MSEALDPDLEQMLSRMTTTARERRAELDVFLATQPATKECALHPGMVRVLDRELSAHQTADRGQPTAAYAPCPACASESSARAETERLHRQGVPLNLCQATLDGWLPRDEQECAALDKVREFARTRVGFLLLLGELGTGKSHLAVGVMRSFKSALWIKQSELLRRLRATYRDRAAVDPIDAAQNTGLLVLDEMGLSGGGRDELPMLHDILDHRCGNRKPTVLTGNCSFEQLYEVIGDRMADRLRESAFAILNFGGSSHRRDARDRYFRP